MQKKNILKATFIAAFVAVAGYTAYNSQKKVELSDLAMANVEALAVREVNPWCPNGCVDNGNGCSCNGIYVSTWAEYDWGNH